LGGWWFDWGGLLLPALIEGAAGFLDAAVAEVVTELKGCREALAGKLVLAEPEVGEAAEVEAVGFSPGVLAVGRFRAVECIAGVPEGSAGVARGEERFGEGEAEVDGEPSEAAGVGEQDARFGFGDGLGEIAEMAVQFAGGVEAAELEIDISGAVGEGARVLEVAGGQRGIVGKEEPS
jgi:hypothetical protein